MTTAPQINLRDGSGTAQSLVFSTNQSFVTLTGSVDTNAVDIQVSIDGADFSSDSSLVELNGVNFTIPNPSSYPDGLPLSFGQNSILIRSIDIVGSVSPTSSAVITRVSGGYDGAESDIPTGVKVRRRRDGVDILAAKPAAITLVDIPGIEWRGFNFYASSSPGGTSGSYKVNDGPVTDESTTWDEDVQEISTNTADFTTVDQAVALRVKVTQEDNFGNELALVSDNETGIFGVSTGGRFTETFSQAIRTEYIYFRHNRAGGIGSINSDQWVDIEDVEPLYYTVTSVFFDTSNNTEFETPHSQEVLGKPLVIDTSLRDLPGRTQLQVVVNFVDAIQRVNEEVTLIPGSTSRDVSIDPFASEAERIWFILDFIHRSQSFLTLLQFDDPNGDGVSDAVATSSYKQALKAALGFTTDLATQQLIDTQFEKLAGNFHKTRLGGRPSVGQVVFYSATKPLQDVTVASGTVVSTASDETGSSRYVVGGTLLMPAADADAYYNFDTQRYEIIADIVAENPGVDGNRPAGTITNVQTSVAGFAVTNTEATVFGTNRETNQELALRAELGFSVDTGTEGGYAVTSAEQIGIVKAKIVKSGDPLMMRDYDDVRGKHIGGKVDIWVQGLKERTVTETFAFTFERAEDIRCEIIDITTLTFRVIDTRVTPDTPIVEILDNPSQGLGVRNASKGEDYDLTGVTIVDYETFRVNPLIQTFTTLIDDTIVADYRFRSVNQFTFSLQPVRRVVAVAGEASGALTPTTGFALYKTDDPLLEGESTIAKNYLVINQVGGIPTGDTIQINNETHVMIGFFEERLQSIGINTSTLRVFNEDRTIEYDGPGTATPDYEIIEGTATIPARIVRSSASSIVSGETVSVDYDHDENFTVTYVINDLLQQLQRTLDTRRHTTADVLAKQAILNSVDLETTIQLKAGASKDTTDPAVRSNVSRELNQKLIGQGTAQSDMINAIDSTEGVDFQVLPLAVMGYADGSHKMRAHVSSSSIRMGSLDIGGQRVFLLTNAVQYPTIDGGGTEFEHSGVFQDDLGMTMATSLAVVGQNADQAWIIGNDGAIIDGYSDDATIIAETGLTDPAAIAAERVLRTANHVVVSLSGTGSPQDSPEEHAYAASYVIQDDTGPHDLQAAEVEFLDLGDLTLTFRSAE